MDWSNETWVKLYRRDTADWLLLSWRARGLFCLLLRVVSRQGALDLGRTGPRAVAALLHAGGDVAEIMAALDELLADGCVAIEGQTLRVTNFVEAQTAALSGRARMQILREKAREHGVTDSHEASPVVTISDETSRDVTPRDEPLRGVTKRREEKRREETEDMSRSQPSSTANASGAVAPLSLLPTEAPKPDPVSDVFAHWQRATGKTRAHLDSKRRTLVARMLKAYTPEQVTRAIDGYAASPWHRGENDRGRAFLGLDLMLRDAEHVEAGWTLADKHVVAPAPKRAPASPRPPPVEPLAYTRDPEVMRKAREFSAQLRAMNEARLAEEAEAKAARLRQADEERAALRTQRVGT